MRLRLKPAHRTCGYVQGAWWPETTRLNDELPALLHTLSLRLGQIDRVSYHAADWSPIPQSDNGIDYSGILDDEESPNVVSVYGPRFGKLALLVVPPFTEASRAYQAVTQAASVNDASTPAQLLGTGASSTRDHRECLRALHRWEAEGGAVSTRAGLAR
ncbi:MAG TPA: DUF5994 family protein [Mycobacterium sp.]|nr:DUF5994 family protein [Mycobacterium sp.]